MITIYRFSHGKTNSKAGLLSTEEMKVLNLYAGIGGNRKLWEDVEVTAVEWDQETAKVYMDYFPDDKMIVGDAHQYLLDHYKEFDFIWSSPPCPTHSIYNNMKRVEMEKYPDMSLYQQIIFLNHWYDSKFCIENVVPYYQPLIAGKEIARHLFWANFTITSNGLKKIDGNPINSWNVEDYEKEYGYDMSLYKMSRNKKRRALRNCVIPELGLHILNAARNIITKSNTEQTTLF